MIEHDSYYKDQPHLTFETYQDLTMTILCFDTVDD